MEDTIDQEIKPESPKTIGEEISPEVWKDLLHTSIVGNGMFLQSFFSQGVLLAERMANLVNEEKASPDALIRQDPKHELISEMMEAAKIKSHKAYHIKPPNNTNGGNATGLWTEDKMEAIQILSSFAKIVHEKDSGDSPQSKVTQNYRYELHKVFSNPQELSTLIDILAIARQSLFAPETKEISKSYKEKIVEFMQKYQKNNFSEIPHSYNEERGELAHTLRQMLEGVKSSMKNEIVSGMKRQRPKDKAFLNRLQNCNDWNLFGVTTDSNIHPLQHSLKSKE
jgi:hypothetical protein